MSVVPVAAPTVSATFDPDFEVLFVISVQLPVPPLDQLVGAQLGEDVTVAEQLLLPLLVVLSNVI